MDNTGSAVPRLDLLGPIMLQSVLLSQYIAHLILPIIPVSKKAGAIPSILRTQKQILVVDHAPKTPYKRLQSSTGQKTYNCTEKGIEEPISIEDDEVLNGQADMVAMMTTLHAILRSRENAVAAAITNTTTFAGQVTTAANTWASASGTPLDDVNDAKAALEQRGFIANAMAVGQKVYRNLCKNAQIRSQVRAIRGYQDIGAANIDLDPQMLAAVFGVKFFFVGQATYDSATEGQTESSSFIWPNNRAAVFRVPELPGESSLTEPCLGRTFLYDQNQQIGDMATGAVDALRGFAVEEYRDETIKANVIRSSEYTAYQILNSLANQVIDAV